MASNEQIAQAAIRADMEHRGYEHTGGGQFYRMRRDGAQGHVSVHYYVSSSEVRIERSPDHGVDQTAAAEALAATLQAEVFGYWPQAIEDVFAKWSLGDLPDPLPFGVAGSFAQSAANEISTGVSVESDGSAYSPGNPRLASDLSNLEIRTKQLVGRYAVAFSDSYVTPLPAVLERQRSLVSILSVAAYAEEEIWKRARADLYQIRTQALGAMNASGPQGGGGTDWSAVLTVVGAVAAGVTAFATAGTSVAVVAALSAAGASAAANLISSPPAEAEPEVPLGGPDPRAVLANIERALNDGVTSLASSIRAQEEEVRTMLTSVQGAASGHSAGMFDLARPDITTAPPGDVLDPQQVFVDPEIIASITALWIPCIAGDLRHARGFLGWENSGAWQRPSGIGLDPTGPMPEYHAMQDTAFSLLGNTAQELDDAGAALLDAARIIGLADEETNQVFSEQAQQIIDSNQNHVGAG